MPELYQDHKVYSLLEITQSLQRAVNKWYGTPYWIKAEMNRLNHYMQSGHCYPDLVERRGGKIVAQIRANLWAGDYQRINEQFLQVLKEPLKDGISILFLARLSFHPVYGMSLIIQDIDPSYTLGDLEREKLETIGRLRSENRFVLNKSLKLPLLPQRIAVISVETSRGWSDFRSVISNNPRNYSFFLMLFPALLQGDRAVQSISRQLERIRRVRHHFDAVAIIRGGGGEVGLTCYNHYDLAGAVAEFPLPVLTGIGHSTNETVTEMVAWKNAITPTELADLLIQRFREFDEPVEEAVESVGYSARNIISTQKQELLQRSKNFRSEAQKMLSVHKNLFYHGIRDLHQAVMARMIREQGRLLNAGNVLSRQPQVFLRRQHEMVSQNRTWLTKNSKAALTVSSHELAEVEKQVRLLHPDNVLKRGYSITLRNGQAVTDTAQVQPGDELETIVYQGKIISKTISKHKK